MICKFEGCEREKYAKGYCHAHYKQQWQGKPLVPARHKAKDGSSNVTYRSAHTRTEARRGKASSHVCDHCGSCAQQWALSHDAKSVLWGSDGKSLMAYSVNEEDYMPLCKSCHKKYDLGEVVYA